MAASQHSPLHNTGFISQFRCGCARGTPCYWSSKPSKEENVVETITYIPRADPGQIIILNEISITPYQAFYHPELPVYAPVSFVLQLIIPRAVAGCEGELVYYESERFYLENVYQKQSFRLSQSAFFFGGEIRLVLSGMSQRQTLSPDVGDNFEDYYMCISHIEILGSTLHPVLVDNLEVVSQYSTTSSRSLSISSGKSIKSSTSLDKELSRSCSESSRRLLIFHISISADGPTEGEITRAIGGSCSCS